MTSRHCAEHPDCPLIDLRCAYEHEATAWLMVQDGVALAYCTEERIVWKHAPPILALALAGRDEHGFGGRPWGQDIQRQQAKIDQQKRWLERKRCEKLGIAVPDWAVRGGQRWADRQDSYIRRAHFKAQQMVSEEAEA